MGIEDFNHLLRDLRTGFGDDAWPEWKGGTVFAEPLRGRLYINPFTVPQSPSENGVSTTQIFFFYDARFDLPPNAVVPKIGDFMTIRNVRYEIIDLQKDDLEEHGLQLVHAPLNTIVTVWDDGSTVWDDSKTAWH